LDGRSLMEGISLYGATILLIVLLPVGFILVFGEQLGHGLLLPTDQLVDVVDLLALLLPLARLVKLVLGSQHE
jgi:hypothetical protein